MTRSGPCCSDSGCGLEYLGDVTVAPITSTIRDIPSGGPAIKEDGMLHDRAINCDHIQTVSGVGFRIGDNLVRCQDARCRRACCVRAEDEAAMAQVLEINQIDQLDQTRQEGDLLRQTPGASPSSRSIGWKSLAAPAKCRNPRAGRAGRRPPTGILPWWSAEATRPAACVLTLPLHDQLGSTACWSRSRTDACGRAKHIRQHAATDAANCAGRGPWHRPNAGPTRHATRAFRRIQP